jgi:hypothetical protein
MQVSEKSQEPGPANGAVGTARRLLKENHARKEGPPRPAGSRWRAVVLATGGRLCHGGAKPGEIGTPCAGWTCPTSSPFCQHRRGVWDVATWHDLARTAPELGTFAGAR